MKLKEYKEFRRNLLKEFKSVRYDHFVKNPNLIPNQPGVYLIYRERDGHPYVGESNDVRRRLLEHANIGVEDTSRITQYVDKEIKKSGLESFQVAFVLKASDYQFRRKMEGKFVDNLNSYHNGFNGSSDGGKLTLGQRYWRSVLKKLFRKLMPKAYKNRNDKLKTKGVRKLLKLKKKLVRLNR